MQRCLVKVIYFTIEMCNSNSYFTMLLNNANISCFVSVFRSITNCNIKTIVWRVFIWRGIVSYNVSQPFPFPGFANIRLFCQQRGRKSLHSPDTWNAKFICRPLPFTMLQCGIMCGDWHLINCNAKIYGIFFKYK